MATRMTAAGSQPHATHRDTSSGPRPGRAQGGAASLGPAAEADSGRRRDLLTSEERGEVKRLRKENAELKRANAILKDAPVYFAQELDPTRRR